MRDGAGAGPTKVPGPEPRYSTPAAAAAAAAAARVARTPHGAASRSSTRVMNDAGPMESMEVPVTAALTAATAAAVASEAVLSGICFVGRRPRRTRMVWRR